MPWSNQGGGGWQGGGGQGPWGRPPSGGGGGGGGGSGGGGGGPTPPDLEDLIRRGQDRVKRWMPGLRGTRGIILLIFIGVAIWLASGFYRVQPDEQGIVLRFGKWTETTQPGLNYHLPAPFETVLKPKVTRVNRAEVGFRGPAEVTSRAGGARTPGGGSLMLTGDENIIDVHFTVFWVIKDAGKYLFNIQEPEQMVKSVAESAMREVIGRSSLQSALSEGRLAIADQGRELTQLILDDYNAGIQVTQVELQKIDPPEAVIAAFRDVQAARADLERSKNEAEAYRNDILPRAKGEAERRLQDAAAYKEQVVARANGEAQRFTSIYEQYRLATDVTRRRLYIETMEQILAGMNKIIVDPGVAGSQGVVPYLPLPELKRRDDAASQGGTR